MHYHIKKLLIHYNTRYLTVTLATSRVVVTGQDGLVKVVLGREHCHDINIEIFQRVESSKREGDWCVVFSYQGIFLSAVLWSWGSNG